MKKFDFFDLITWDSLIVRFEKGRKNWLYWLLVSLLIILKQMHKLHGSI